jgi:hypothetical protein
LTTGPKGSPRLEKKETTHIHLHRASATPRHHLIAKTTSPPSQPGDWDSYSKSVNQIGETKQKNKGGREGVGRGGTEFCWLKDQRNGPRFLQLLRVWSPVCGVVASGVTPVCGEAVSGVTGVVVSHVTPVSCASVWVWPPVSGVVASCVTPCLWRGCFYLVSPLILAWLFFF